MNWSTFQTHNEAPEKAFETLCNQLFENWCEEEYDSQIKFFNIVNGSGGDGGIESYATLLDDSVVGLQAKWFSSSISTSQINQIKNSIKTAVKIRPQVKRYIVCVPRDLASLTRKGENTEESRWTNMISDVKTDYPDLTVELWNETRILSELQKDTSAGIYKYWFENSEISEEAIELAFEKSKASWLHTKYVPDLNTYGKIHSKIILGLGEFSHKQNLYNRVLRGIDLCEKYVDVSEQLISLIETELPKLKEELATSIESVFELLNECKKIKTSILFENTSASKANSRLTYIDFNNICEQIRESNCSMRHFFHSSEVTNVLQKLSSVGFYRLFKEYNDLLDKSPLIFVGEPGTGKTHGVASVSEKILKDKMHTVILVQARNIPKSYTWRDIIVSNLGLSSSWSEDEIWQALTSMVNRHKANIKCIESETKVLPKVLVIIDAIDECQPYDRWIDRIQESAVITEKYPQIRFCFTSRRTAIPNKIENANKIRISSDGDVPVHELFDSYMTSYNITATNKGWLKFALTTPLALKIFCELNRNKTIDYAQNTDVSITKLFREKIDCIENEYSLKESVPKENQHIFNAIIALSREFLTTTQLERKNLLDEVSKSTSISINQLEKVVLYLENYGVLASYCKQGEGLFPDEYYYIPGIQGYFDYAMALLVLQEYEHPKDIDFSKNSAIDSNALYTMSVISMQKYDYLITRNETLPSIINSWDISDLQFYALRHTSHENGELFKDRTLEIMSANTDSLLTITNNLILPLSRDIGHPLGVQVLDEFLFSFEKPAQRDLIWSVPGFLNAPEKYKWSTTQTLNLEEEFCLTKDDVFDGCPSIYVWALSNLNNSFRKQSRDELMRWAKMTPDEFWKLFLKYANVNDPQIKSDLLSILTCLVYDSANDALIKNAADWVCNNILSIDKIAQCMDVSLRYYSIAIVKKSIIYGLNNESDVTKYLPPYHSQKYEIPLNKDALSGTYMGGYSEIDYDLSRYVLIDHFTSDFSNYGKDSQFKELIEKIGIIQPEFKNIEFYQLVLSAAYAYILNIGWTENDFCCLECDSDGKKEYVGLDVSVRRMHYPATHGSKSNIMTVCEKYIWQFRNWFSGFLSDRIKYINNGTPEDITDYGLLDDFLIPIQEIEQIDPDNLPEDSPWYIPERGKAILDAENHSSFDIINSVTDAPNFNWQKWILVDNTDRVYKLDNNSLLALSGYSCFFGSAMVETCIFISSVIVDNDHMDSFVSQMSDNADSSQMLANPPDWRGGLINSCYITPKEVCWFPWKKRYDSSNVQDFPGLNVHSAVDECCYNFPEYGDVHYELPSEPLRKLLNITDSNGYVFYDSNKQIKAQYTVTGEKWRTYQDYLLVRKDELLSALQKNNKNLVWIMREYRREAGKGTEKYGKFWAVKDYSYIGYFKNNEFICKNIRKEISKSKIE